MENFTAVYIAVFTVVSAIMSILSNMGRSNLVVIARFSKRWQVSLLSVCMIIFYLIYPFACSVNGVEINKLLFSLSLIGVFIAIFTIKDNWVIKKSPTKEIKRYWVSSDGCDYCCSVFFYLKKHLAIWFNKYKSQASKNKKTKKEVMKESIYFTIFLVYVCIYSAIMLTYLFGRQPHKTVKSINRHFYRRSWRILFFRLFYILHAICTGMLLYEDITQPEEKLAVIAGVLTTIVSLKLVRIIGSLSKRRLRENEEII